MKLSVIWILGAAAFVAGCSTPSLEEEVQQLIDESGATFSDCGTIAPDPVCDAAGNPDPAAACLVNAFVKCTPVRADETLTTIEGDPIPIVYLVVPDDAGGCHVVTFHDATQDSFGSGRIEQSTCDGARLAELCGGVSTEGCQ